MKTLKFVFILAPSVACAQVYFPLHVGDWWSYGDFSYVCEGGGTIYRIVGTNVFKGLTYFRFLGASPFSGPFARADSMRVFTYDTTMQTEYTVFDFSARAGDTVSVRNSGSLITIALGSLRFQTYDSVSQHGFIYEVRDSLGVVSMTPNWVPCES
ncbi:MAG TPA: hypothetical protein VMM57_09175, partial [Bacteroidota bacterium]|nr:hypothetical protein [Bacteroidota bacterium]